MRTKGGGGRGGSQLEDDTVVWEDPPPVDHSRRGPGQSKWTARLVPLMKHPGRWAKIAAYDKPASAQQLPHSLKKHPNWLPAPVEEWEFVSRVIDDSGYVYARYMPGGKEES